MNIYTYSNTCTHTNMYIYTYSNTCTCTYTHTVIQVYTSITYYNTHV